jgi:hypothetical protein
MLNFYGFRIVDYETGELERTDEYEERFLNLNYCSHNNLRISTPFPRACGWRVRRVRACACV